jgi:hypothetical protein
MKLILLLLTLSTSLYANNICTSNLEALAVQTGGRTKPYYVMANENIKFIVGKSKYNKMDARELFCRLSFDYLEPSNIDLPIKVEHIDTKKLLGLDAGATSIPASAAMDKLPQLRSEYQKQKFSSSYKKDLEKVIMRIQNLDQIKLGAVWKVPKFRDSQIVWHALKDIFTVKDQLSNATEELTQMDKKYIETEKR